MSFQAWPKIHSLNNVVAGLKRMGNVAPSFRVGYRCKIKLHGTNAAVVVQPDGTVTAQSRNQIITPKSDNYGFAAWVHQTEALWSQLARPGGTVYVYGEWAGNNINNGDAVCMVKERLYAVFAMRILSHVNENEYFVDPMTLHTELESVKDALSCVYTLPWMTDEVVEIELNGNDDRDDPETINAMVEQIGKVDPWVLNTFGIEAPGEGVVAYPVSVGGDPVDSFRTIETFMFKAKHARHSEKPEKKPAKVKTTVSPNADALARGCVTAARCDKGRLLIDPDKHSSNFAKFLHWLSHDILDEVKDEIEASGVIDTDVKRALTPYAKQYWFRGVLPEPPLPPSPPPLTAEQRALLSPKDRLDALEREGRRLKQIADQLQSRVAQANAWISARYPASTYPTATEPATT